MSKRAVSLRHLVSVFAFLDRVTLPRGSVLDFVGKGLGHGLSPAAGGVLDDPAHGQRDLAGGSHFHGNLISRAADTAGFYFQAWTNIFQRLVENFERIDRV